MTIELRWLNRNPVPDGEAAMILQYRTCDRVDAVFPGLPRGTGPWTEWKNVPVVNDEVTS
jgi:hypothetical protein